VITDRIPAGVYCYDKDGACPYHHVDPDKPEQENGWCSLTGLKDWIDGTLLWDMCKECEYLCNEEEGYE